MPHQFLVPEVVWQLRSRIWHRRSWYSHVINFGLPKAAEDYVRRIGRTVRVESSGVAVSFTSNRNAGNLKKFALPSG